MKAIIIGILTSLIAAIIYDLFTKKYIFSFFKKYATKKREQPKLISGNKKLLFNSRTNYKSSVQLRHVIRIDKTAIPYNATLNQAHDMINQYNCWRLPVESRYHEYQGIVFKDKIARAIREGRGDLNVTTEMLTKDQSVSFYATDTCEKAHKILNQVSFSNAPVTLNKQAIGFIDKYFLKKYLSSN